MTKLFFMDRITKPHKSILHFIYSYLIKYDITGHTLYFYIVQYRNFLLRLLKTYRQTSLIRTIFFEKFCSDNRNSGFVKVFNIRLDLEFFLNKSGLSRIPD